MIRVAALLLVGLLAPAAPARAQDAPPSDVRVMTFNIWLGGDVVDFGNVIAAIRDARADIVGLQEAEGNTRRIAEHAADRRSRSPTPAPRSRARPGSRALSPGATSRG